MTDWIKQVAEEISKTGAKKFTGSDINPETLIQIGEEALSEGWSAQDALNNMFNSVTGHYESGFGGMEIDDSYWKVIDLRNQYMSKVADISDEQYSKNLESMTGSKFANQDIVLKGDNGYGIAVSTTIPNRAGFSTPRITFTNPDGTPLNSFQVSQDQDILKTAERYGFNLDDVKGVLGSNPVIQAGIEQQYPSNVPGAADLRPTGDYTSTRPEDVYQGADINIPTTDYSNYQAPRGLLREAYGLPRYEGEGYRGTTTPKQGSVLGTGSVVGSPSGANISQVMGGQAPSSSTKQQLIADLLRSVAGSRQSSLASLFGRPTTVNRASFLQPRANNLIRANWLRR